MTGASVTAPGGLVAFSIPEPGDYRFLRYEPA
jgi:hypothetical protein